MSRRSTLTLFVWLICQIASPAHIFAAPAPAADRQDYSAEELVAALTETLTSIDSLYCDFTQVEKMGDTVQSTKRAGIARFGDKWHITEFSLEDDKVSKKENVVCFDGERVYSYFVTRLPDGKVHNGTVQIHDFQDPPLLSPEYLLGMRLSNLNKSIPAICQVNKATKVAKNPADESGAIRMLVSNIPNGTTPDGKTYAYDVSFALDASRGMLPSEIRVEFAAETKAFVESHRSWFQQWRVQQFARVLDESSNAERWFPSTGILEQSGQQKGPTFELSLENIRLNANLEENLFNPEIPSGTTIFDMTAKGRGQVTLAGGKVAFDNRMTELVDKTRTANGRSLWKVWFIAANVVALTLVVVVLWWRRKSTMP